MNIPDKVDEVIKVINSNGYEAYAVGGCVRDTLLKKVPNDWDVTTSAKPEVVKSLFNKTIDTGIKHGTVTVINRGECIEVTTFRIDGEYSDNRRPDNILYTNKLSEDLKRRDFTINAMAYSGKDGIVDLFNGKKDLKDRVIKCVGNPDERFNEDGLRMLRAIRFSAQLNFEIEVNTFNSIKNNNELIKNISEERVCVELTKILISDYPEKIMLLYDTGLMEYIIPEFEKCIGFKHDNYHHIYDVGDHILHSVKNIENNPVLRWTMFLHDIGKPDTKTFDKDNVGHFYGHPKVSCDIAKKIMKRLKFSNKDMKKIERLILNHDYELNMNEKSIRKAVSKIGDDIFIDLLKVKLADNYAKNIEIKKQDIDNIEKISEIYFDIKKKGQCLTKKQLNINGKDLIDMGIQEGKLIGEILDNLFKRVISNPELNDNEKLKNIVKKEYIN